jgi:hypothetical protein
MPLGTLYKLDKIVMPSSVEFHQIHRQRWVAGIQSMLEHLAGHPHPMFTANQRQQPAVEFTTSQLDTVLANIGVGGAAVGSTATYFKKVTETGSVARATTEHERITLAESTVYWTTLRLPHNGRAEIDVVMVVTYDGSNEPFVFAGTVALSGNLSVGGYWGLGPCSVNGTAITGPQDVTIESGVQLIQAGDASELYDTFCGVEKTAPRVTIRTLNRVNWSTLLGLNGLALNGTTGLVVFARKYAANDDRVANGTNGHIKLIGLNGQAVPQDSSGEETGLVSDTCVFNLISGSDSILPLTATTNTTIS